MSREKGRPYPDLQGISWKKRNSLEPKKVEKKSEMKCLQVTKADFESIRDGLISEMLFCSSRSFEVGDVVALWYSTPRNMYPSVCIRVAFMSVEVVRVVSNTYSQYKAKF